MGPEGVLRLNYPQRSENYQPSELQDNVQSLYDQPAVNESMNSNQLIDKSLIFKLPNYENAKTLKPNHMKMPRVVEVKHNALLKKEYRMPKS